MLWAIAWCFPMQGEVIRKVGTLVGGAFILSGIIAWLRMDGEELLDCEILGPAF